MVNFVTATSVPSSVTSTGTAVLAAIPLDSSGGKPRFIRVSTTASANVLVGNAQVVATANDLMVQPADSVVLNVSYCTFISVKSVSGTAIVNITPIENGKWNNFASLQDEALSIVASYGTDAHVYLPGIGTVNGLVAGNYIESTGITPCALNDVVGKVNDANGSAIALTQDTTANKPVLSKRYNLLTKTEDFSDAIWDKSFVGVAPTGTAGTYRLTVDTSINVHLLSQTVGASYNLPYESLEVKADGLQFLSMGNSEQSAAFVTFDIVNGTKTLNPTIGNIISLGDGWFRVTCKPFGDNSNGSASAWQIRPVSSGTIDVNITWAGDGTSGILIRKPQYQPVRGNVTTVEHPPYQRVNTATDYDTSVGYNYWRFADANDNLTTGAETFGADMDCFMAVMPDTTAQHVYVASDINSSGNFFGVVNSADALGVATGLGVGTVSTYKVNGVDVAGGTSVKRDILASALGTFTWKVLEVRNLNLAAWGAMSFGAYTGFAQPHKLGIVIICPALSEADRAIIRKFCGSFVGVTI